MKRLLNTTYFVTVAAIGMLGILFVITLVPIPGNVKVKVVKSGSMEPFIHVGSIVVIKPEATYQVGDVVTFGADTATQIPTTHRIVNIAGDGQSAVYTTKGDANDAPDPSTTHLSDIEGKEVLTVPYLGYVLAFARTKLGFFLLVGIPALAVFFEEGRAMIREIRRMRAKKRRARLMQEVEEPMQEQPPRRPSSGRMGGGVMGVLFFVGLAGIGSTYGSTLAYYSGKAVSPANIFQAGVFDNSSPEDIGVAPQFFRITAADITDPDATSTDPGTDDATSTPPAPIVVDDSSAGAWSSSTTTLPGLGDASSTPDVAPDNAFAVPPVDTPPVGTPSDTPDSSADASSTTE